MTRIAKSMRGQRPTKRLPMAELAELLRRADRRVYTKLGVVVRPEGESSHFELVAEDGGVTDVLLEVELQPDRVEVTARLASSAGGPGRGLWTVPSVGAEVAVLIPDGALDWMPIVVGVLSSGAVPAGEQGVAADRTIIVDGEVLIHDGAGGAESLVKRSELEAVNEALRVHTHLVQAVGEPTGPAGGPAIPNPLGPPPSSVQDPTWSIPDPTGTTVLKAR